MELKYLLFIYQNKIIICNIYIVIIDNFVNFNLDHVDTCDYLVRF